MSTSSSPPPSKPGWTLVWADEFDVPGLPDPAKWGYETGNVRNNELQYYTESRLENARVEHGHLIIEAHREPWEGMEFTSASLHTLGKHRWLYGRFEIRAKVPAARGTWPAFWTLGENYPVVNWPRCGEIDILEHVAHMPGVAYGNVHYGEKAHYNDKGFLLVGDAACAFHVYAVEWYPDRLDFMIDDKIYFTFRKENSRDGSWPYDLPHYLIVNLAVGGVWGGEMGIDRDSYPQRLEVDYIRVYQQTQ